MAVAPYDLSPIAPVPVCAPEDVAAAVVRARQAQPGWAGTSIARRGEMALAFHHLLLERQDQVLGDERRSGARARAVTGTARGTRPDRPAAARCPVGGS
ncbi:aldehyde dehydrogenase family protein [Kutzneria viridogrisea]